ncbi:MAG: hypothetical protein JWL76_1979 [Thermoleophilia bacterium]|nr:hypothetical protein [Thermoleophilia bacterium]
MYILLDDESDLIDFLGVGLPLIWQTRAGHIATGTQG